MASRNVFSKNFKFHFKTIKKKKKKLNKKKEEIIDGLILMTCQPIWGYYMPTDSRIAFIACSYEQFLRSCFLKGLFAHGPII